MLQLLRLNNGAAQRRSAYIDTFDFPEKITTSLLTKYPHLEAHDINYVIAGLREYFQLCRLAGKKSVSMPSQVVDHAWHEFILFTRLYQDFCNQAFGYFLHHTPAEAMTGPANMQRGIKLAWKLSCQRSGVNPKAINKLPILFTMDRKLNIEDGFRYSVDCSLPINKGTFCVTHIQQGGGKTKKRRGDCSGSGAYGANGDGCGGCG